MYRTDTAQSRPADVFIGRGKTQTTFGKHGVLGSRWLALLIAAVVVSTLVNCSSSPEATDDDMGEFIGAPPTDDDDALFRHALPAEAVPADATGRIGAATPDTDDVEPPPPVEEEIDPPPDLPEGRKACFSCVRICPVDGSGTASCADGADDLICGWGSHDATEEASQTAEAHCEASLEMARYMPNYSEITGECPPATCR